MLCYVKLKLVIENRVRRKEATALVWRLIEAYMKSLEITDMACLLQLCIKIPKSKSTRVMEPSWAL